MRNLLFIIIVVCSTSSCTMQQSNSKPAINHNGVNIAFTVNGKTDSIDFAAKKNQDTAIVFIHGWSINKEYWKAQEDYFSKRFTTVAIDLGGHGQSGKNRKEWTAEQYAGDVLSVIRGLDLKKVILVGHSMSGDVGLLVADSIPDRLIGFVGVDNLKSISTTNTPQDEQQNKEFLAALRANYDSIATLFCKMGLFPPNYKDSNAVNRVIGDVLKMDTSISIATLESLGKFAIQEGPLISHLKIPLHLIVSDFGEMDEKGVGKFCQKGLVVAVSHGTGHYPMIEKPDVFNSLLEQTLSQIATGK